MDYVDTVIRLSKESSHCYVASALDDGDPVASNSFALRFDELKVIERLKKLETATLSPKSEETFHIDFGQELYRKVLAGNLGNYFSKRLGEAEAEGKGLRVSLQFDEEASELATLPWEFLHDGEDFLVARRDLLLSRLPSNLRKIQSKPLESILRMLVVVSSPHDSSCAPLDAEKERERILEAIDKLYIDHKIEVDFTDEATFETIQSYLNERDYHIVHFTGHGRQSDGHGYLILENDEGGIREVDNQVISDLFAGRGIRLVVLSACQSADLANKLIIKKIPAVVAMQYSVMDKSATWFASAFYQALANDKSVDLAMTEARIAMRNAEEANGVDFATPILYLLDPDCLHVDRIKPTSSELFQKPMMLGDIQVMHKGFIGRQRELRILQKAFMSGIKRAAIIHGWGGIGKTVLATRLALGMNHYFEGVFGYKCNLQTRPEDILNGLNALLILAGISTLNQILYQPMPLQAKTAVLVNILNQRRFLIILDNFESCLNESRTKIADPELQQFIEHLLNATATSTKYIITTRYDFDPLPGRLTGAIEHLPLPEMPFYDAVWLMNNHAELAKLDLKKKEEIYRAIGGHPWTIGMFARHASINTVDGLLMELEPLKRELRDFTLFDKSYSMLDEPSKELLLRASIFEEAVPIDALRWMMGDEKNPSPFADKLLEKPLQWGLMVRQDGWEEAVYSVHTLVREFVEQEAKAQKSDKKKLQIRAAQYYENLAQVNRNLWNLLRARDYYYFTGEWDKAAIIVNIATEYLTRWGYIELAINLLSQSAETTSGIRKSRAKANLAGLYYNLGDWKTALKMLIEAKEIFEKEDGENDLTAILSNLGIICFMQGNYTEAIEYYQQSLDLAVRLNNKKSIAATLHQLGMIYHQQGNYSEAFKYYQQSWDISRELQDKWGMAMTLRQMGMAHTEQGDYQDAACQYQHSLETFLDLGDRKGVAMTLHSLGNILLRQGNYPEAIKIYHQCLEVSENLGDRYGLSIALHQLSIIHGEQGNYPEAIMHSQHSLAICEELGDKRGIGRRLYQLGKIYLLQCNFPEAIKVLRQSLDIAKDLGDKQGIAQSLNGLGVIHQQQGNYQEATILYQQSLSLAKELGDKCGIATSLHQLGTVQEKERDFERALQSYVIAFSIFEELHDPNLKRVQDSIHQLRDIMGEDAFKVARDNLGELNEP